MAILCLLSLISSARQPMSRAESDRIMNDYRNFYYQTRGVPVRHVDK